MKNRGILDVLEDIKDDVIDHIKKNKGKYITGAVTSVITGIGLAYGIKPPSSTISSINDDWDCPWDKSELFDKDIFPGGWGY